MIEVIPAIMPASLTDLQAKCAQVRKHVSTIQLDIMDGVFVPETTWPYTHDGAREFAAIQNETESMPYWDSVDFEVDLMVADPDEAAFAWAAAGASRIIIHIESTHDPRALVERFRAAYGNAHDLSVGMPHIGVAIGSETEMSSLTPLLPLIDFVQCMGIARIGYQGEPFDERVVEKIAAFHEAHPEVIISVDGGVSFETAPRLIQAGATRLVSGSAIFTAENPAEAIAQLANAA